MLTQHVAALLGKQLQQGSYILQQAVDGSIPGVHTALQRHTAAVSSNHKGGGGFVPGLLKQLLMLFSSPVREALQLESAGTADLKAIQAGHVRQHWERQDWGSGT